VSQGRATEILDIADEASFARMPPCVDDRFDHRSCDYWEDGVRGNKSARPSWWQPKPAKAPETKSAQPSENPFASAATDDADFNPFAVTASAAALDPLAGEDLFATPAINPFAPTQADEQDSSGDPRKLRLLKRGRGVFGSYAKILLLDGLPAVYAQFGPLSAYPRAQHVRELYPRLPQSPLPAVITCIASTDVARGEGIAAQLVGAICEDLATRGFSAVETYPDLTLSIDEASAAHPGFWTGCGFVMAVDDERYPVMRLGLD
jgi:hypothetical protein